MLAWLQNMGKKRRRPTGATDASRGGAAADSVLHKAVSAAAIVLTLVITGVVWRHRTPAAKTSDSAATDAPLSAAPSGEPLIYKYTIERQLEHSPEAFTQGLEFDHICRKDAAGKESCEDVLWESTGMNGESSVREVSLETGAVRRKALLAHADFAEGITRFGDKLYQLTWQSSRIFAYSVDNFDQVEQLTSPLADGWGICTDGRSLIVSDSSATLTWLDPATMVKQRTVEVHDSDRPVAWINEMEWVNGEIWANVWQTECLARIDPADGTVVGWVLLQGLGHRERQAHPKHRMDVLNGIAWDAQGQRLFVTGKWWHTLYQVKLARGTGVPLDRVRQACIPTPHALG